MGPSLFSFGSLVDIVSLPMMLLHPRLATSHDPLLTKRKLGWMGGGVSTCIYRLCENIFKHICMCTHTHIYIYIYIYIHMRIYTRTHTHTHTHTPECAQKFAPMQYARSTL